MRTEYVVVRALEVVTFAEKCEALMENNWIPLGGVSGTDGWLLQAFIRQAIPEQKEAQPVEDKATPGATVVKKKRGPRKKIV